MLTLQISEAEIATLRYEMYHYPDALVQKRLHCVYIKAVDNRLSCEKIGLYCGLCRQKVSEFIHIYKEAGIAGLTYNHYGTNTSELDKHSKNLIEVLDKEPVHHLSQAVEKIKELTGIQGSVSAVRNFLKRHHFAWRKIGHIPAKAEAEKQQAYLENTLQPAIEKAQKQEIYLLFVDAAHFVLGIFLCSLWTRFRTFIASAAGRKRFNIIGAVDAISKKVFFQSNTTVVNAETLKEFLSYLKKIMPDKPIALVLDNARYQHCKVVKEWAKQLDITLLFLPAYSPNLNLIERLWKFVKKKALYGKFYEKFDDFQMAITQTLNNTNTIYQDQMKTLLNLNFQSFKNVKIYPD